MYFFTSSMYASIGIILMVNGLILDKVTFDISKIATSTLKPLFMTFKDYSRAIMDVYALREANSGDEVI